MAKIASVGDILKDKYGRCSTVIKSSTNSFTAKYAASIMEFKYDKEIKSLDQAGFTVVATHDQVLGKEWSKC
jgi:hypothetical protein